MKRREFIAIVGGAPIAWPLVVRAQQPIIPGIGYLSSGSPESDVARRKSFQQGLSDSGFVLGRNVAIDYRYAGLNRPGGNITGVSNYFGALGGKRLELLRELAPKARLIGYLLNPDNPNAETHSSEVQAAARVMGQPIDVLIGRSSHEIEAAFAELP